MRIVVVLALALVACGPAGRDENFGTDGGGGGSGSGNGNGDGCSDEAKLVYVVDSNRTLSRFDPTTKSFVDLGQLSCPASFLAEPFSMGIDRNAVAWVLYSSGELFSVDTETLACTKSSWAPSPSLLVFGMGFSANTAGSTDDTLFVAGGLGPDDPMSTLATLSTQSFTATTIGTVTGWPELTGTGNAELWGWFPDVVTPQVRQIDKATGSALETYNLGMLSGQPSAWAFAFWGGDFWIFLERQGEPNTTVYQIDGGTGDIKGSTPASGRRIVGAGVSTCAPVIIL